MFVAFATASEPSGMVSGESCVVWMLNWSSIPNPSKPAVDPQNWAGSRELAGFRRKWFFIGTDAAGKRCKGEAVVELVAGEKE